MTRLLLQIFDYFQTRRPLLYSILFGLFLLLGLVASRIRLEEDVSAILPGGGGKAKEITEILKNSNIADKVIVKIIARDADGPESLIPVAEDLAQELLQRFPGEIAGLKSKVDDETTMDVYQTVQDNLPVFLEESDYRSIDSLTSAQQIPVTLEQNYSTLTSASGFAMKQLISDDPLGISLPVLRRLQNLQMDEHYDLYDGYIVAKDRKSLYLFITLHSALSQTGKNEILFEGFDAAIEKIAREKYGVRAYYYGNSVVAAGNARQLKKDSVLTLSITVVCLLLFIGFAFRRKRVPVIMMLPVVFGGLFSLALIALFRGTISTIAVGAGSIVLGIAINYSIHFFTHYKHCGSARQTIIDLYLPVTVGSFTTIGSFLALALLQSRLLNDFGWFAGLSLVGAAVFTLVFLPQMMPPLKEANSKTFHLFPDSSKTTGSSRYGYVLPVIILLLTVFFLRYASQVKFESDLNTVNFLDEKTKRAQKEIDLTQDDTSKVVFIASTGADREQMLENNEQLKQALENAKQKGWIQNYSSLSAFIPSQKTQEERIRRWNEYWTPEKKETVLRNLRTEGTKLKFSPAAFNDFETSLSHTYTTAGDSELKAITEAFGKEYLISEPGKEVVLNSARVEKEKRKLLYAELQKLESAVVLDKQIITNNLVEIIMEDFNTILLYTSSLVFIALLFTYGRLELTIITFLPMVITWIWILGIMGLFCLHFNVINIIISTFIFGLGDDFGIFMTDGLIRRYRDGKQILGSHKTSIFLCAVTILIGLGALIFAQHPALKSIALISIIGIFSVVIIGQTIQPLLFNFFIQSRKEKGRAPWTITTLALTVFSFTYFSLSAVILTLLGYLLFLIPFLSRKKKKLVFHYLIHAAFKSLTYIMANVRKRHIDKQNMDFSKPAIIIANHTSVLDILLTVSQHPKVILLTNRWVYYSPVFGKVVQMADYYPSMEGVNPALDKFEQVIKDGYSIVIFPEGTRSVDGNIKRFHKGAFYLAEQLKLDIVPLVIQGGADTLRKGDFMIFNGQMTLKYLPRVTANDKSFGEDYARRAKNFTTLFRDEYDKLKAEIETASWFRQKLVMNYLYTGLGLEWQARKEAKRTAYFDALNKILPIEGTITEIGCGYGFTTYMMHFLGEQRSFVSVDADEEKISVAEKCYSKTGQLNFVCSDTSFEISESDACIIHSKEVKEDLNLWIDKCMKKVKAGGPVVFTSKPEGLSAEYCLQHVSNEIYLVLR